MYPGYTVQQALNEYAIRFFTMLAAGRRQLAQERMALFNIFSAPYLEQNDRADLITRLRHDAVDPELIEFDSDDYSGLDQLKGILES